MIVKKILIGACMSLLFLGCGAEDTVREAIDDVESYVNDDDKMVTDGIEGDITEDISAVLRVHNEARAEVGIDNNLTWSETIATDAQSYADEIAQSGVWEHDTERNQNDGYGNGNYGENLYTRFPSASFEQAALAWVDEKKYYTKGPVVGDGEVDNTCVEGFDANGNEIMCGHYTQIIWEETSLVGCGKSEYTTGDKEGWDVVVCKYQTPGNIRGETPY